MVLSQGLPQLSRPLTKACGNKVGSPNKADLIETYVFGDAVAEAVELRRVRGAVLQAQEVLDVWHELVIKTSL